MLHHHDCHKNANKKSSNAGKNRHIPDPKTEIIRSSFWEDLFPDF
jgi:hypothetical protein